MSAKKIHELLISLGINNPPTPNTMTKYIPTLNKPPSEKQFQSWKTFLKKHSKEIRAMDYFEIPTLRFKMLYVLIIINHGSRKIEHFAISKILTLSGLSNKLEMPHLMTINQNILFMTMTLFLYLSHSKHFYPIKA